MAQMIATLKAAVEAEKAKLLAEVSIGLELCPPIGVQKWV
jgi:hypothetical protein